MGCDIHSYAERKDINGQWGEIDFQPFDWRSYGMYGFLADVRNYSGIEPISKPRGLPNDLTPIIKNTAKMWGLDGHSHSWLTVAELLAFNYDAPMEDRRADFLHKTHGSGPDTCEPGDGIKTTYRKFLGEGFFTDLKKLQDMGAERIVFWFDS